MSKNHNPTDIENIVRKLLGEFGSGNNPLDNSSPDNYNARVLYKIVFFAVDFTNPTVENLILNATADADIIPITRIPQPISKQLFTLDNGILAVKLIRYVENNFEEGFKLVQTILKKCFPRINNYIKKESTIKDNFFTTLGDVYKVNILMPENRIIYYLIACCLANKFIPVDVQDKFYFNLQKFNTKLLICDLSGCDEYIKLEEEAYEKFDDDTGFYNADLGDVECNCKPFRELVTIKPNTTAKDLRAALIKEFNLKGDEWKDPYDIPYTEFVNKYNEINYKSLPKFVKINPLTTNLNDIQNILSHSFISIKRCISEDKLDLVLDLTMRYMGRYKYGIKQNYTEIRDYIAFLILFIQQEYLQKNNILNCAIELLYEENISIKEREELKVKLRETETLLESTNEALIEKQLLSTTLTTENQQLKNRTIVLEEKLSEKEDIIKSLQKQIKLLQTEVQTSQVAAQVQECPTNNTLDINDLNEFFKSYNIVLIGANPDFKQRMTEHFPTIKHYSTAQVRTSRPNLDTYDFCILDVSFTGHSDYYFLKDAYKGINFIIPDYKYNNIQLWGNDIYNRIDKLQNQKSSDTIQNAAW